MGCFTLDFRILSKAARSLGRIFSSDKCIDSPSNIERYKIITTIQREWLRESPCSRPSAPTAVISSTDRESPHIIKLGRSIDNKSKKQPRPSASPCVGCIFGAAKYDYSLISQFQYSYTDKLSAAYLAVFSNILSLKTHDFFDNNPLPVLLSAIITMIYLFSVP